MATYPIPINIIFVLCILISPSISYEKKQLKQGDIIFHISKSSQSKAIQLATKSKYSHCGIIYIRDKKYYVFEAVQPVKLTPLQKWINRGENKHFVVKRVKNGIAILDSTALMKMYKEGEKFKGKDYDLYFEWSDKRMYCSEIIWKVYYNALGLKLCELEKFNEFDFSHPIVKKKLKERFGNKIPKYEFFVSPKAIFESKKLITVIEK